MRRCKVFTFIRPFFLQNKIAVHPVDRCPLFCYSVFMEQITTTRLLLRPFTMRDVKAAFAILSDEKTNEFLPWFPARTENDAESFLKERFSEKPFAYAICRKETNVPFGYICISDDESRDLGYGAQIGFLEQRLRHGSGSRGFTEGARSGIQICDRDAR